MLMVAADITNTRRRGAVNTGECCNYVSYVYIANVPVVCESFMITEGGIDVISMMRKKTTGTCKKRGVRHKVTSDRWSNGGIQDYFKDSGVEYSSACCCGGNQVDREKSPSIFPTHPP